MPQTEIAPLEKEVEKYKNDAEKGLANVASFIIVTDADKEELVNIGKKAKDAITKISAYHDPKCDSAHKTHKMLTTARKEHLEPYEKIVKIVQTKSGTYDHDKAEAQRQIDLKKQQEETDKHNRAIKAAEKRVEGLLEGVQDSQMKIDVLTDQLDNGNFTEDEAGIMREQITLLETAIQNKQDKVETVVAKVEEKAPVTYVAPPVEVKNWTGTVVNVKALCQAIADGKIGVGAIKTWNMPYLQSLKKNGQDVPGMSFVPDHGKGQRLK